ncbi:MAG: glycosyltransferase family 39 protein [Lentimicrobium sp.]|nr:glycosyltransferase family 39 protein [Lentimicrobium sp.]
MKLNNFIKYTLILTTLLFAYSLWQRQPDIDDAWIGEHAYWMAQKGYVKSELMHGITNQHILHIVHHKFFTLLGASFVSLFGFSLFTLKSVSLFGLIIFLFVFYKYQKRYSGQPALLISFLLVAVNAFIFQYSFVYRPEIIVMTLGFISFICLERGISESFHYKWIIISGLLAGLSGATHLNGLIYISAGGLLLLIKRKPLQAIIFGLSAIPTFAVYFYDFTREFNFEYWLYQIKDAPALHNTGMLPDWLWIMEKPFREQMRFFHSPKEISLTLLFLFLLIVAFKKLKLPKDLLIYLALLIISLSTLAVHSTSKYLILYLPFMFIVMSRGFAGVAIESETEAGIIRLRKTPVAYWAVGFLFLYIIVQTVWNVKTCSNKFDPDANRTISEKFIGSGTEKLNVLAPMNYIFNEIGHFNRIQGDLSYADIHKTGIPLHGSYLLRYADSTGLDYLIITKEYKQNFGMDTLSEAQRKNEGFVTIENNNKFEILKNEN